jgi:pseudaminic acid cytidylyltransferase
MRIAIIPARGGSKRIPRKNIRDFLGVPIIAYSIRAALDSTAFDKVVVSTDDEEIATVARAAGAEVPFLRPASLSDDHTGTNAVIKHALSWFSSRGETFEQACCIYATAPFIQVRYLREGLAKLESSGKSYAFSVTSFAFPIQRSVRINRHGTVEAMYPEFVATRSQDLEDAYHDAGQFYWGRTEAFLQDAAIFSPASVPVILPRYMVQDIDTLEDWHRAELMFKALELAGDIVR